LALEEKTRQSVFKLLAYCIPESYPYFYYILRLRQLFHLNEPDKMKITKLYLMVYVYGILTFPFSVENINAQTVNSLKDLEIMLIDSATSLYKAGDFYIGGQPNDSTLKELKEDQVKLIVNIRTPKEVDDVKDKGFDEAAFANALGIAYFNIPVGGDAGYHPEAVQKMDEAFKEVPGKKFIHCRGAGRATLIWMAWLVNYGGTSVADAISYGKQIRFQMPLEDFLGYELSYEKK
jgi:protein tyrosine phosphatase (PTP) superfamily phosphohydrolase (DUF442 family)